MGLQSAVAEEGLVERHCGRLQEVPKEGKLHARVDVEARGQAQEHEQPRIDERGVRAADNPHMDIVAGVRQVTVDHKSVLPLTEGIAGYLLSVNMR